jgi:hypothetical protein
MDLSHLENFTSSRKQAVNKISKFGQNLSKLILSEEIKEYLLNRNGQIAVISDLPIEWLYLDEFPLCYTHDVCRIPEYNQNSIVNNYIHNQRLNFLIKSDLIEKSFALLAIRKWRRGRYQPRVNTNKVGPFYILKFFSQLLLKWGSFSALRVNFRINKVIESNKVFKFVKTIFLNFNDLNVDLLRRHNADIESKIDNLHVGRENENQNSSIDLLRSIVNSDKDHVKSFKIIISNTIILGIIISMLLLQQNVESNPGPPNKPNLNILTFNFLYLLNLYLASH